MNHDEKNERTSATMVIEEMEANISSVCRLKRVIVGEVKTELSKSTPSPIKVMAVVDL